MLFDSEYEVTAELRNVNWGPEGDAALLVQNAVAVLNVLQAYSQSTDDLEVICRENLPTYIVAVEEAQVRAGVRQCAATAVPIMRHFVEGTGFSAGQLNEFVASTVALWDTAGKDPECELRLCLPLFEERLRRLFAEAQQ